MLQALANGLSKEDPWIDLTPEDKEAGVQRELPHSQREVRKARRANSKVWPPKLEDLSFSLIDDVSEGAGVRSQSWTGNLVLDKEFAGALLELRPKHAQKG